MMRHWSFLAIGLVLAACSQADGSSATASSVPAAQPTGPMQKVQWRALVAAGDDSISVFDNAVDEMTGILAARGVSRIDRFTSDPTMVEKDRMIATADSMAAALASVPPGPPQACLVFLTSHGTRHGLRLTDDFDHDRSLDPSALGRMLDAGCSNMPTVAIVSGCYSGIFIGRVTEAPNRIILTAARDDRTSFGCSAEERLTYFDDCLFQAWPKSQTFAGLFRATEACVRAKENALGMVPHSEPQAWFGDRVTNLLLP
ncbi:C13 family peptidase [Dongia sp. agr-C8]